MSQNSQYNISFPSMDAFDSYIEALREGYYVGIQPKATAEDIEKILADPAAHLQSLNEQKKGKFTAPDGSEHEFVPYETLWMTSGKEFIGSVSLRLKLTKLLQEFGGHVGYGIRPKYQGQGLGVLALSLTKERALNVHGIDRLRLSCNANNPASEKIILKNGGVYEDTVESVHGFKGPTKRFWIELK